MCVRTVTDAGWRCVREDSVLVEISKTVSLLHEGRWQLVVEGCVVDIVHIDEVELGMTSGEFAAGSEPVRTHDVEHVCEVR